MIIFSLLNFLFSRLSAIRGKSSCLLLGVAGPSPSLTIMIFFNIAITIIAFFVTKSIASPSSPSSWLPSSITLSLNHHPHHQAWRLLPLLLGLFTMGGEEIEQLDVLLLKVDNKTIGSMVVHILSVIIKLLIALHSECFVKSTSTVECFKTENCV